MRIIQAGDQELIGLEPQREVLENLVSEAGYDCQIQENGRQVVLELRPSSPNDPLLLFDAGHAANLGWFSRCQFYVEAVSGRVLQTPFTLANCRDEEGRLERAVRISVSKELPVSFRVPGHEKVSEQMIYTILFNLLQALRQSGVAVCGRGGIEPLAGPATP
jgi:hypothetical protein